MQRRLSCQSSRSSAAARLLWLHALDIDVELHRLHGLLRRLTATTQFSSSHPSHPLLRTASRRSSSSARHTAQPSSAGPSSSSSSGAEAEADDGLSEVLGDARLSWYPGHMHKTMRALEARLRQCELVLEVRDARLPFSSANPQLDAMIAQQGRRRVIVFNKADLIPAGSSDDVERFYAERQQPALFTRGQSPASVKRLLPLIEQSVRRRFGTIPTNVLVVGYPNVGKCFAAGTLLRLYSGSTVAAEQIIGGEQLMGDDGSARLVLAASLSRGRAALFRIQPLHSAHCAFSVTGSHILVLLVTCCPRKLRTAEGWEVCWYELQTDNEMRRCLRCFGQEAAADAELQEQMARWSGPLEWEVSVDAFRASPHHLQSVCRLISSPAVTFAPAAHRSLQQSLSELLLGQPVSAEQRDWAAWYLGLSLAASDDVALQTKAVQARLRLYGPLFAPAMQEETADGRAMPLQLGSVARSLLRLYGVEDGDGVVPAAWLLESVHVRSLMLAGVMDAHRSDQTDHPLLPSSRYLFRSTRRDRLASFALLAASLGISSTEITEESLGQHEEAVCLSISSRYYWLGMSGAIDRIARLSASAAVRDVEAAVCSEVESRCVRFTISAEAEAEYWGFAVSGANERFLLADFTVTHNSSIINNLRSLSLRRSGPRVAPTPGFTRHISGFLVSTSPPLFLLDTPGVMIPSFSSAAATQETALKLALTRAFRDSIVPSDVIARYLLLVLNRRAAEAGEGGRYEGEALRGLHRTEDAEEMLAWVAARIDAAGREGQGRAGEKQEEAGAEGRRQQSLKDRAVQFLLRKFRSGEMGAMMLDDVQAELGRLREAERQRQEMLRLRQERRQYEDTVRTGKKISIITLDDQQQQTDGEQEKG